MIFARIYGLISTAQISSDGERTKIFKEIRGLIEDASFPIAVELLEIEHERLMRDHFDDHPYQPMIDLPNTQSCDGCGRAYEVRQELNALKKEVTA